MVALLSTLKAIADANRLKILALLAQAPRSGDELAALLDLKPSTISHHLTRLQKVGLVESKAAQYYHIYSLDAAALQELQRALTVDTLMQEVEKMEGINEGAYRQQVLAQWVVGERLQGLPTPIRQRDIVLQWLTAKFTPDLRYGPNQVDDVLDQWCNWADFRQLDITSVTRALVDGQQLARTRDGRWYWRADSPLALADDAFVPENLPPADTSSLHVPLLMSPLRVLVRFAMRIRANHPFTADEIDAMIQAHRPQDGDEPAAVRLALVEEGLLQQRGEDAYLRPTIGSDHPATAKLRAEPLARQAELKTEREQ